MNDPSEVISAKPAVRLVILNYNGIDLLRECVPSLLMACRESSCSPSVTVLDNRSTDGSRDFIESEFPDIDYVEAPENLVLCSFNDYLRTVSEEVAILLNNDLRADPGFIDPLVRVFEEHPDAFLAAPKVMNFEGTDVDAASSRGGVRWGMFWCSARYPGFEASIDTPSETLSSGFGAFHRARFLELGGYDRRFLPGTLEDVDLCWRARQKGYRSYYEPRSVLFHKGQATFKRELGAGRTAELAHRNTFLFMWKNFRGPGFWILHLLFLPARLVHALLTGRRAFMRGFFQAIAKTGRGHKV